MPDAFDPLGLKSRDPIRPEREGLGVGPGIALGCAVNLGLIILIFFLLSSVSWGLSGKNLFVTYFGIVLLIDGILITYAYRRKEEGVVIGLVIATSLVALLGGICWSSF